MVRQARWSREARKFLILEDRPLEKGPIPPRSFRIAFHPSHLISPVQHESLDDSVGALPSFTTISEFEMFLSEQVQRLKTDAEVDSEEPNSRHVMEAFRAKSERLVRDLQSAYRTTISFVGDDSGVGKNATKITLNYPHPIDLPHELRPGQWIRTASGYYMPHDVEYGRPARLAIKGSMTKGFIPIKAPCGSNSDTSSEAFFATLLASTTITKLDPISDFVLIPLHIIGSDPVESRASGRFNMTLFASIPLDMTSTILAFIELCVDSDGRSLISRLVLDTQKADYISVHGNKKRRRNNQSAVKENPPKRRSARLATRRGISPNVTVATPTCTTSSPPKESPLYGLCITSHLELMGVDLPENLGKKVVRLRDATATGRRAETKAHPTEAELKCDPNAFVDDLKAARRLLFMSDSQTMSKRDDVEDDDDWTWMNSQIFNDMSAATPTVEMTPPLKALDSVASMSGMPTIGQFQGIEED